jgi:hypothetical protein
MSKRYPDFADGSNVAEYKANLEDDTASHLDTLFQNALDATSIEEALCYTLDLPEMDYHRRLSAMTNIFRRFPPESIYPELSDALMDAMNENALNLALKTLPLDKAARIEGNSSIPLDDIGFSRPPTYYEAMAVAGCWDITQNHDVFRAAGLMFEEIKSEIVEQDLAALAIAEENDLRFVEALVDVVQREDLERSGYYEPLDD